MQFRIAAGQPADVAGGIRRPSSASGENGDDLRAGRAPAFEQMRIDEGERRVARQRDALSGRAMRARRAACWRRPAARAASMRVEIDVALDEVGQRRQVAPRPACSPRLHQAEMALRQAIARCRASAPNTGMPARAMRVAHEPAWRALATLLRITPAIVTPVAIVAQPAATAAADCACPDDIEHQHHRPSGQRRRCRRWRRCRPGAGRRRRRTGPSRLRRERDRLAAARAASASSGRGAMRPAYRD